MYDDAIGNSAGHNMGIGEIITLSGETLGLFKTSTEIIKSIKDIATAGKPDQKQLVNSAVEALRDKMQELQEKHMTLQQLAMSAMEQNLALVQEKRAVEEKLAKLDKFEASRDLYERIPLALNTSAYREKAFTGPADEQPLFCPQCFDAGRKSYFSFHEHAMHTKHLKCAACGTSAHVTRDDGPAVMSVRVKSRRDFFDDY